MCRWMMENGTDENKQLAVELSRQLGRVEEESCLVCREVVPIDSLTHGKCKNGHTLPRCCRTLLLTRPILLCPRCQLFVHKEAEYLDSETSATCAYCDGFVINKLNARSQPRPESKRAVVKLPHGHHSKHGRRNH
ncbi:uncharacterized protein LOC121857555 [Homarus americanus]|uniref:uncharacterized protein LOC121857555 n=1 Tax=Homarus americanus TaxID=6706 RepID=UPI001C484506|nr:uncharacterized protein LOC121857555 [Homarus americanus]